MGMLVLDDDTRASRWARSGKLPITYARLAADQKAKWGYKPVMRASRAGPTRTLRAMCECSRARAEHAGLEDHGETLRWV